MKDKSDSRTHDMHGGIRIGYACVSTETKDVA